MRLDFAPKQLCARWRICGISNRLDGMSEFFDKSRRIIGAVFLGLALLMLVLGQTVLSQYLKQVCYILYWLICTVLTLLAASVALVDLASIKKASREEQRELIEETLRKIERDKRNLDNPEKDTDESV